MAFFIELSTLYKQNAEIKISANTSLSLFYIFQRLVSSKFGFKVFSVCFLSNYPLGLFFSALYDAGLIILLLMNA